MPDSLVTDDPIPNTTAREFERWLADQPKDGWPIDLWRSATAALLSRQHLERPASEQSDTTRKLDNDDIAAFAEAHTLHALLTRLARATNEQQLSK